MSVYLRREFDFDCMKTKELALIRRLINKVAVTTL